MKVWNTGCTKVKIITLVSRQHGNVKMIILMKWINVHCKDFLRIRHRISYNRLILPKKMHVKPFIFYHERIDSVKF